MSSPYLTPLHVEILLHPATRSPKILPTPELSLLHTTIERTLQSHPTCTSKSLSIPALSSLTLPTSTTGLQISEIRTTLSDDDSKLTKPTCLVKVVLHLYTYAPVTRIIPPPGASVTPLPSPHLHSWERLHFKQPLKSITLSYILTRHSYPFLPSSGFLLLHGAPGTGKSSLAEALAQKVSIRLGQGYLVRVTHSSLSKYFGESANRIGKIFEWVLQQRGIVVIVMDEIESFGMRRESCDGGDGIRVTNALLTGLDSVRGRKNVVVIGTSNTVSGIDAAVRDRADLCLKVCNIGLNGCGVVLKDLLEGLVERGVLDVVGDTSKVVDLCQGLSGRRVEGCVMVALGLVAGHSKVDWGNFEMALRKAVMIASGIDQGDCGV